MEIDLTKEEKELVARKKLKLMKVIGEARFAPIVAERVVTAEVLGLVPKTAIERGLKNANDAKLDGRTKARYIYFAGAMKNKFAELGLAWPDVKAPETLTSTLKRMTSFRRAS